MDKWSILWYDRFHWDNFLYQYACCKYSAIFVMFSIFVTSESKKKGETMMNKWTENLRSLTMVITMTVDIEEWKVTTNKWLCVDIISKVFLSGEFAAVSRLLKACVSQNVFQTRRLYKTFFKSCKPIICSSWFSKELAQVCKGYSLKILGVLYS